MVQSEDGTHKQPCSLCVFTCTAGSGTEYLGTFCCVYARNCRTGLTPFKCMCRLHFLTQSLHVLVVNFCIVFCVGSMHGKTYWACHSGMFLAMELLLCHNMAEWGVPLSLGHAVMFIICFWLGCCWQHPTRRYLEHSRLHGLTQTWAVSIFVVLPGPELCASSCGWPCCWNTGDAMVACRSGEVM